jgi:hypothetical protein
MKKLILATTFLLCILLTFSATGLALDIDIGGVDIGIGGPPLTEFSGPPELVPIPGRYVYFVPDVDYDLFFYHSLWYRPYKGRWFRSDNYGGPWEHVRKVPSALIDLPTDYRTNAPRYSRIPYGELRNNWEIWEQEKHWDRRVDDRERGDWHGGIRTRIHKAKQSIERGIEQGDLTSHEAKKLNEELENILDKIDSMKEDGHLSEREREKINHDLDRLERDIRREKSDDDRRGDGDHSRY